MKSLALFAFIAMTFTGPLAFAAELGGLEAEIDAFVQSYQPVADSGIAVGVVQGDQLIYFKGYGFRDRAAKKPVTPDTLFRIGSNSKSFLSSALNVLADEGRLDIDNPVQAYLPDFQLQDPGVARRATLVDLLSHRVGLPRHDGVWYLTPFTREELFHKLSLLEMNKHPGYGFREKWQYNNLMFMTLGMVGEKVSGLTWQELVKQKLLSPLQMNATGFSVDEMQLSADYALPYAKDTLLPFIQYEPIGPAGVDVSNVTDLRKWISLFLNHGRLPSGTQLISEAAQQRMFHIESQDDIADKGIHVNYGLGWFLQDVAGRRLVWHGGNIDGYSTHVSFMPEENLGLIILVNQNNGSALEVPWIVREKNTATRLLPVVIYEHLLQFKQNHRQASGFGGLDAGGLPRLEMHRPFDRMQPRLFFNLTGYQQLGNFDEPAYGDLQLYRDTQDVFHLVYYGHDFPLKPAVDADSFTIELDGASTPVTLERGGTGVIAVNVLFEPSVNPIHFSR